MTKVSFAETRIHRTRVVIPERGVVAGCVLTTESNQVSFLPPVFWRQENKLDRKEIIFLSGDLQASLTLQLLETGRLDWSWAAARSNLTSQWPGARVTQEADCYSCGAPGRAYDLEQIAANGSKMVTRRAIIPYETFRLEITLRAPKSSFAELRHTMGTFLASVRAQSIR